MGLSENEVPNNPMDYQEIHNETANLDKAM